MKSAAFRAKWEEKCPEVRKKLPYHLLEPHNEEIFGKDQFLAVPLLVRIDRMEMPLRQTESSNSDSEDSSSSTESSGSDEANEQDDTLVRAKDKF